ncbi:hypothetical protein TNCT_403361 [Trichonephila clavata]|uniref:Uncharacterized protein n=1 Tax=Trichonephila clavata TaxID=2740835 RepID=A0A8X6JCX3_TRICU|nr:hypothetical protein TNCT_403361 [Trichonephila clavata]
MECGFPTVHALYSTIQCLQPVHGQQDTFLSRKCIHPQQNSGLKLSMNILRTLTSNTGFHTTRRSLTLVGIRIALGNEQRESIVLPPRHRGFRFQQSSTRHVFRLQSMLQTCQWTS